MDVFVQTRLIVCSSFALHLFIHLLPFARLCGVRSQHWLSLFTLSWQEEQDVGWKIWRLWSEKNIDFKNWYKWLTRAPHQVAGGFSARAPPLGSHIVCCLQRSPEMPSPGLTFDLQQACQEDVEGFKYERLLQKTSRSGVGPGQSSPGRRASVL